MKIKNVLYNYMYKYIHIFNLVINFEFLFKAFGFYSIYIFITSF